MNMLMYYYSRYNNNIIIMVRHLNNSSKAASRIAKPASNYFDYWPVNIIMTLCYLYYPTNRGWNYVAMVTATNVYYGKNDIL